jgi:hypothetical protein
MPCLLILALGLPAHADSLRLWGKLDAPMALPQGSLLIAAGQDSCLLDSNGNFSFPALKRGPLDLLLEADGFEPMRHHMYHRQEEFLKLEAFSSRDLLTELPAPIPSAAKAHLAPALLDLRQEGWPEANPWLNGIGESCRSGNAAGASRGAWGGMSYFPAELSGSEWQAQNGAGFFGNRFWQQSLQPTKAITENLLQLGLSTHGQQLEAGLGRSLGSYHRLGLEGAFAQGLADSGDRQSYSLAISDRWNLPAGLQLNSRLLLQGSALRDLSSNAPWLWLHAPSADSLKQGDLDNQGWTLESRLSWAPGEDLRLAAMVWLAGYSLKSQALEQDLLRNRLISENSTDPGWFNTRREEERPRRGLRLALDQLHPKGRLQLAMEVEDQARSLKGWMEPDPVWFSQSTSYLQLDERQVDFRSRLSDYYLLPAAFDVEATLDLEYRYYEFERKRLRMFTFEESPHVDMKQDLLALNPLLALGWNCSGQLRFRLSWLRRQRMLNPQEWWNGVDSPEDPWAGALVNLAGDQANQALLAEPVLEELRLESAFSLSSGQFTLGSSARRWQHLPLERLSMADALFDPTSSQRGQVDLEQLLLDASWTGRLAGFQLKLLLARAWLTHETLVSWRSSDANWLPLEAKLDRLPGEAKWSMQLDIERGFLLAGRQAVFSGNLLALGERNALNDYRAWGRLDKRLRLDLAFTWQLSPRLDLKLDALDLLPGRDLAWVDWSRDTINGDLMRLDESESLYRLSLAWRPGK